MFDAVGEALAEHGDNDKVLETFKTKIDVHNNLITDDARRHAQADFLRDNGSIFIRVECADKVRKDRCSRSEWTDAHISDTELQYEKCDYTIHNGGNLAYLKELVDKVCDQIFGD